MNIVRPRKKCTFQALSGEQRRRTPAFPFYFPSWSSLLQRLQGGAGEKKQKKKSRPLKEPNSKTSSLQAHLLQVHQEVQHLFLRILVGGPPVVWLEEHAVLAEASQRPSPKRPCPGPRRVEKAKHVPAQEIDAIFAPKPVTLLAGTAEDPTLHARLTGRRELTAWLIAGLFGLFGIEFVLSTLRPPVPAGVEDPPPTWWERTNEWLARAVGSTGGRAAA